MCWQEEPSEVQAAAVGGTVGGAAAAAVGTIVRLGMKSCAVW